MLLFRHSIFSATCKFPQVLRNASIMIWRGRASHLYIRDLVSEDMNTMTNASVQVWMNEHQAILTMSSFPFEEAFRNLISQGHPNHERIQNPLDFGVNLHGTSFEEGEDTVRAAQSAGVLLALASHDCPLDPDLDLYELMTMYCEGCSRFL